MNANEDKNFNNKIGTSNIDNKVLNSDNNFSNRENRFSSSNNIILKLLKILDMFFSIRWVALFFCVCSCMGVSYVVLGYDIFSVTISGVGYSHPVMFAVWGFCSAAALYGGMRYLWLGKKQYIDSHDDTRLKKMYRMVLVGSIVGAFSIIISTLVTDGGWWTFKAIVHTVLAALYALCFCFSLIVYFVSEIGNNRLYLFLIGTIILGLLISVGIIMISQDLMALEQVFVLVPTNGFLIALLLLNKSKLSEIGE